MRADTPQRVPGATYRLQFNHKFTFDQAAGLAEYLRDLGITDCYASPLFKARPQSEHGYDICAFDQLNPELGTPADFDRFSARLHHLGLGLILDMVPNHMAADPSNRWWSDVLQHGKASRYARFFDIDWQPPEPSLRDKVLLPILEDDYVKELGAGKIQMVFSQGALFVSYSDHRFPASPKSYPVIFDELFPSWNSETDAGFSAIKGRLETQFDRSAEFRDRLTAALRRLNGRAGDPSSFDQLHTFLQLQHFRLGGWRTANEQINYRRFFDVTGLVALRMELPEVFAAAHELLFRFFQEGKVTGLRIDHPDGLWEPKKYLCRLQAVVSKAGLAGGTQPLGCSSTDLANTAAISPSQEPGVLQSEGRVPSPQSCIIVEKILSSDEPLPPDWPVAGTTGYDFLNRLNGLFIDGANNEAFDRLYRDFTGCENDFLRIAHDAKMQVLQTSFLSELKSLALQLQRLATGAPSAQDSTFDQLHSALTEIIAAFPVYRTYISEETLEPSPPDKDAVTRAVRGATSRCSEADSPVLQFIQDVLLRRPPADPHETKVRSAGLRPGENADLDPSKGSREFVMKFQQLTGPVAAKGIEDTAFYRFNRLVSLNEVGGDPAAFGFSPQQFHSYNEAKAKLLPHSLLATATHDTKRGEDVRARINVLSEMPELWEQAIKRWGVLNTPKKYLVQKQPAPHPNDEYLLYQTLVGAWAPEADRSEGLKVFRKRLVAYMLKAIREAKVRTSWTDPNSAYEDALKTFIEKLLADSTPNPFLDDFKSFQRKVAFFGRFNSLSQVLLKLTSPGVPDVYQGTELWDLSLVDPDNRRPVDYELRKRLLAELKAMSACTSTDASRPGSPSPPREERAGLSSVVLLTKEEERRPFSPGLAKAALTIHQLLLESHTGQIKLFLIWRTLEFRRAHRELFDHGDYLPLTLAGPKKDHVCAFARQWKDKAVIIIAPRLVFGLLGGIERVPVGKAIWQDTTLQLPTSHRALPYRNVLTDEIISIREFLGGQTLPLADAFNLFPVALLELQ